MLKLGVLNLTLKSPPDPKRSVTEPRFLEAVAGAGRGAAATGAGARGAGTGLRKFLLLPDTAEDTVWETRGPISDTIWATMLLVLGARAGAGAGAGGARGRLPVPETAVETVWEIRG